MVHLFSVGCGPSDFMSPGMKKLGSLIFIASIVCFERPQMLVPSVRVHTLSFYVRRTDSCYQSEVFCSS